MGVLVIAEHDNSELKPATLHAIKAAASFDHEIDVLVAGQGCDAVVSALGKVDNVIRIYVAQDEAYQNPLAENLAVLVQGFAEKYHYILAPATTFGKDIMPRVAALLDVACISDVIEIVDKDTFKHPIYAGNAIETVKSHDKIKCMTIRSTAFQAMPQHDGQAAIENIPAADASRQARYVRLEQTKSDRPELTSAKIVVSGGRGFGSKEKFMMLESLAAKLNAAIGASRAAVDAGYAPNDYQVGQTGKIVAPELYLAIGISGAIQHIAGMKDSRVIVAINKDEAAPIFDVADYGLVGDLFDILPELEQKL